MHCTSRFRDLKPIAVTDTSERPWIHIAPKGEFPGRIEIPAGYDVPGYGIAGEDMAVDGLTVIGDEQLAAIMAGFSPDVLIDYEHFSSDPDKSTEAAGWGSSLRSAPAGDGLELQTLWSGAARAKVLDQSYRYVSPVFAGAASYADGTFKFHPVALAGAGLTNRPKLKTLRPVSANKDNPTNTPDPMNHKEALLKHLDLSATASDQEITDAMAASKAAPDAATTKCRDLETAVTALKADNEKLRAEVITSDLERFAPVISDRESATILLQTNREAAVKFFTAAAAAKATTDAAAGTKVIPLYQKNKASPPDGSKFTAAAGEDPNETERLALVATVKNREGCPFEQAWTIAKGEKPELFQNL